MMTFRFPRTALFAAVSIAMIAAIACGTDDSPDGPVAAAPEPTATPVPTVSSEPITADPNDDPAAFIAALPDAERQCLVDTLGEATFGNLLAGQDATAEDGKAILACVSDNTIQRVIVGQIIGQGGIELSDATLACIDDRLSTVDYHSIGSMFFDDALDVDGLSADDLDTELIAEAALSLFPAIFCLNDDERAALGSGGSGDAGEDDFFSGLLTGTTIDALECGFDAAGPEGLISLVSIADEGELTSEAFAVFGAVIAECGALFAESGLLDGDDGSELLGNLAGELELPDGIAIPDLEGLDLEGLLSGGDLEGLLGGLSGLADLEEIPDLIATVESVPEGDIGSLVSPETLACLVDQLGQEQVDGLLDGTLEPDFSILGAVLSCGLDLSSIGN